MLSEPERTERVHALQSTLQAWHEKSERAEKLFKDLQAAERAYHSVRREADLVHQRVIALAEDWANAEG